MSCLNLSPFPGRAMVFEETMPYWQLTPVWRGFRSICSMEVLRTNVLSFLENCCQASALIDGSLGIQFGGYIGTTDQVEGFLQAFAEFL